MSYTEIVGNVVNGRRIDGADCVLCAVLRDIKDDRQQSPF